MQKDKLQEVYVKFEFSLGKMCHIFVLEIYLKEPTLKMIFSLHAIRPHIGLMAYEVCIYWLANCFQRTVYYSFPLCEGYCDQINFDSLVLKRFLH